MSANSFMSEDGILSLLDIIDLDEHIVDEKLTKLIERESLSSRKLKAVLVYIEYKRLICLQEGTDCDNDVYVNFAIKSLFGYQNGVQENELLLNILTTSLLLNQEKIQSNTEHIVQQIISGDMMESETAPSHLPLKILDTILGLCLSQNIRLIPLFLRTELEKLLEHQNKVININFFSHTVPLIMKVCRDFSLLNVIWNNVIERLKSNSKQDFVIVCTLSQFYLPLSSENNLLAIKSSIVKKSEFWELIQYGLLHNDFTIRKCSIYLARRAICVCEETNANISQKHSSSLFYWSIEYSECLKESWNSLFTLVETLEEKQSELVLSALKLYYSLSNIHHSWYYTALVRGLSHSTNAVVNEVIKIALKGKYTSEDFPFVNLLTAINNTCLFEYFDKKEVNDLKELLNHFLQHNDSLLNLMRDMCKIKLSPIPKFYMYSLIGNITLESLKSLKLPVVIDLFQSGNVSSNNLLVDYSVKSFFLDFIINHKLVKDISDLLSIVEMLNTENTTVHIGDISWQKLLSLVSMQHQICEDNFSFHSFWDKCFESAANTLSLSQFLILLTHANIINMEELIGALYFSKDVLNGCKCTSLESCNTLCEKHFYFITNCVKEVCKSEDNNILKNGVKKFFNEANIIIINFVTKRFNHFDDEPTSNLISCLKGIIFHENSNLVSFEQIVNIGKECLLSETESQHKKLLAMKIISCFVFAVHRSSMLSDVQKYELINPLHRIVADYSTKQRKELSSNKIISEINKERISIYVYNLHYFREWDGKVAASLYEYILEILEVCDIECLEHSIALLHMLFQRGRDLLSIDDFKALVDHTWKEIFCVRKSGHFINYLKNFINIIFHKDNLKDFQFNNILLEYAGKITEFGEQLPDVVYIFMQCINSDVLDTKLFNKFLVKGLIFGTPLRRDQRIEQAIISTMLTSSGYCSTIHPNSKAIINPIAHVRVTALSILLKQDTETLAIAIHNLINEVDVEYRPSNRYHGNSMHHRMLLRAVQFLCVSSVTHRDVELMRTCIMWCTHRLSSQPHHVSCRVLFEWYISLYMIYNESPLTQATTNYLNLHGIPQLSYFTVLYHIVTHRLKRLQKSNENVTEYFCLSEQMVNDVEFVIQTLLPYTMGQIFNIRLHAQYFVLKILELLKGSIIYLKYNLFGDVIKKTFDFNKNDNNLLKIQQDIFINEVDVVDSLSLENIYFSVLNLTNVAQDEWIPLDILESTKCLDNHSNLLLDCEMLVNLHNVSSVFQESSNLDTNVNLKKYDLTVQRKFVPWQQLLSDIGVPTDNKTGVPHSELIVVASLIDRLPNLGGLSRTCEVFGVKKYVISSLRHLQDKQFQSTSMSSEKLLDVSEQIPGENLIQYLYEMRKIGYAIVAAEQTSSSVSLKSFQFPKKTLLLVGHEKDGIPCDLICLMDHCVEIPQQGMVRSLNVHVTASVFIWEYVKQHCLIEFL